MNLKHKREKLVKKLTSKDYRDAWVDESVKMIVPYQIQAIRNQKGWSQEVLGKKAGMLRNAVSRLESVDYGNLSVNTLLRIAHGFDCGLLVKFVPFSRLTREFEDVSASALQVNNFSEDYGNLMSWLDEAKDEEALEVKPQSYQPYPSEEPSYTESAAVSGKYSVGYLVEANQSPVKY